MFRKANGSNRRGELWRCARIHKQMLYRPSYSQQQDRQYFTHRQGTKCYFLLLNSAELAEFHSPVTPLGTMANMDLN